MDIDFLQNFTWLNLEMKKQNVWFFNLWKQATIVKEMLRIG